MAEMQTVRSLLAPKAGQPAHVPPLQKQVVENHPQQTKKVSMDPIITKVRLEYADGSGAELVGEEAVKWKQAVDAQAALCYAHCLYFPNLDWKETPPPTPKVK